MRHLLLLLACSTLSLNPFAATASDEGPDANAVLTLAEDSPAAAAKSTTPSRQIEEIVVTATKREQSLRDIPASIGAIDGDVLESSGAQELSDFLRMIPGVTQNTLGSDQNRVTIRGMGADTSRLTTSQTTATLIGETSFSDPLLSGVTPDVSAFDLAGVEVLKGPQGTLYGGSGLTGAIRYIPRAPELQSWGAKLSRQYTQVNQGDSASTSAAAVNMPLSQRLGFRGVGVVRHVGGLIDDSNRQLQNIDSRSQHAGRAMLRYEPTDRLQLNAMYMRQNTHADDLPFASDTNGHLMRSTTPGPSTQETNWDMSNLHADWDLGPFALVSVSSHVTKALDSDSDVSRLINAPSLPVDLNQTTSRLAITQRVRGSTQEFRVVSQSSGAWQWLAGVFALDYHQFFRTHLTAQDSATLVEVTVDVDNSEYAVFADATGDLSPAWQINLGGRAYQASTSGMSRATGPVILATTQSPENVNEAEIVESGFNPKVALTWFISDALSSYASISQGFRFGGIQGVSGEGISPTYESDTLWNYELGLRTEWLQRQLLADFTLFYGDWDKPQLVQRDPSNTFNTVDNVGSARIRGAEAAVQWLMPLPGLSLTVTGAYTDARTAEPFNAPDGTPVPEHTRLPGTGLLQTATTLAWQGQVGRAQLNGSLVHSYVSDAHNDLLKNAEVLGYQSWDLRGGLALPSGLELTVNVSNLADVRGIANILFTREDAQDVYYVRPRAVDLRVAWTF